jgi:hypothetical protein
VSAKECQGAKTYHCSERRDKLENELFCMQLEPLLPAAATSFSLHRLNRHTVSSIHFPVQHIRSPSSLSSQNQTSISSHCLFDTLHLCCAQRQVKVCMIEKALLIGYLKRGTIRHTYTQELTYLILSNVTACVRLTQVLTQTFTRTADHYSVYAHLVTATVVWSFYLQSPPRQ